MYKNYIFDLDGTILDTLEDLAGAVNYALEEMNYPVRTLDEVRQFIGNGVRKLIFRSVPQGTGEAECEKALALFTEYYLEHLADRTKPYNGIPEMLNTLKENGCKLAVVSNKADRAAKAVVKSFFSDCFDIVLGKTEDFPAKPDPASVLYVTETLKMEKEDTIYIGDSDVDVFTAHNAGLKCIGVTWGNRGREELVSAGAEFIADSPNEIYEASTE